MSCPRSQAILCPGSQKKGGPEGPLVMSHDWELTISFWSRSPENGYCALPESASKTRPQGRCPPICRKQTPESVKCAPLKISAFARSRLFWLGYRGLCLISRLCGQDAATIPLKRDLCRPIFIEYCEKSVLTFDVSVVSNMNVVRDN